MRRLAALLGLLLAGTTVALGLAEAVVRLTGLGLQPEPPAAPAEPDPRLAGLPQLTTVQDLARPHVRGVFAGVLHRTNSAGMRGPEVAPQPAPGVVRIVLVGDSVTMGHGVEEADSYALRTQRALDEHFGAPRFEVLNFGVAGLNIRHVMRRLARQGLAYQPRIVVYGFTLNDIEGPAYLPNSEADGDRQLARLQRFQDSPSQLLRVAWPRAVLLWSAIRPLPGSYEYALERNYFHEPAAWRQVTDGLDKLAALTRPRGICPVLFVHTRLAQLRGPHFFARIYARVEEAARERGIEVIQSHPHLRGHDAAALRFGIEDPHPNARGHALLAEALVAGLLALPPACGIPGAP